MDYYRLDSFDEFPKYFWVYGTPNLNWVLRSTLLYQGKRKVVLSCDCGSPIISVKLLQAVPLKYTTRSEAMIGTLPELWMTTGPALKPR